MPALLRLALAWTLFLSVPGRPLSAAEAGGFSFQAPKGWRLKLAYVGRTLSYDLTNATNQRLSCRINVTGSLKGGSLAAFQQDAANKASRMVGVPPAAPVIQRSAMRTTSGLLLTRAEVRYSWFLQPGLRRGPVTQHRAFFYSFQAQRGRIYSLNCFPGTIPDAGDFFDAALDDLARSIELPQAKPKR